MYFHPTEPLDCLHTAHKQYRIWCLQNSYRGVHYALSPGVDRGLDGLFCDWQVFLSLTSWKHWLKVCI